jgi:hypothetical protein
MSLDIHLQLVRRVAIPDVVLVGTADAPCEVVVVVDLGVLPLREVFIVPIAAR